MKVLFRSDSSSQIGFGHIKRDLVLAKQYSDVSFACLPLEGSLIDEIPYLFMSLIVKAFTNLSISSKKKNLNFLSLITMASA